MIDYELQEKLENISAPKLEDILDDNFSYPTFVQEQLEMDDIDYCDHYFYKSSVLKEEIEELMIKYYRRIDEIILQYAYDYFINGKIKEDIYTPAIKKLTLEYIDETNRLLNDKPKNNPYPIEDDETQNEEVIETDNKESSTESIQRGKERVMEYLAGKIPLGDLYLSDLDNKCGNIIQNKELARIKTRICAHFKGLDENSKENMTIGEIYNMYKKKTRK